MKTKSQFSKKYYLQLQQSFCGRAVGFVLPRLANLDDETELTGSDRTHADYHATLAGKSGTFEEGYYEVNLREYYNPEADPIDSEVCVC